MKRICLGISESKMSRCWASEKVPWQWGSLREALKVTRTLTTGRPGERAPAPLVGLDSDQSDNEQGGGLAHTPPGPFHPQGQLKDASKPWRGGWGRGRNRASWAARKDRTGREVGR